MVTAAPSPPSETRPRPALDRERPAEAFQARAHPGQAGSGVDLADADPVVAGPDLHHRVPFRHVDPEILGVRMAGRVGDDLLGAANDGDNPVLKAILARSPELDVFDAALVGDNKRLAAFVAKDPKLVTAFSPLGWQPLMLASFGGNLDGVKLLLAKGAEVNARASTRFRNTSLQIALLRGEGPVIIYLLEHGADANVRQNQDFTPLHEAAFLGRIDLIQLLLDHGAEINARSTQGETPLGSALRRSKSEAVSYLRARGAKE